jgi:hypothetical protein
MDHKQNTLNDQSVFGADWHSRFESNLAARQKLNQQVRWFGYNAKLLRKHLSLLNENLALFDELDHAGVNEALDRVGLKDQSAMFDSLRELRNRLAAKVSELHGPRQQDGRKVN